MIRATDVEYRVSEFVLQASLAVAKHEYFVLLGPTGSGKTVFLECLAGLRIPASGTIVLGGHDVTNAEPRLRYIGYVPQDYALMNHLGVFENIAFGLRVMHMSQEGVEQAVDHITRLLGIEDLLPRPIQGLSGGERQRVALARALAIQPNVLLLDEPVSALDEATRDAVCRKLRHLPEKTGVTVIHVCHSFDEARLVADRIGVMRAGRIVQTDAPDEIFAAPRDTELARFLRVENIFSGTAEKIPGGARISVGELGITASTPASGAVEFSIDAAAIRISDGEHTPPGTTVTGKLARAERQGPLIRLELEGGVPLVFYVTRKEADVRCLAPGATVAVVFPSEAVRIFGKDYKDVK